MASVVVPRMGLWARFSYFASRTQNRLKWYLVLPTIIILVLVTVYPLIYTLRLSVTDYNLATPQKCKGYIGLDNYRVIVDSAEFWNALKITLTFTIPVVLIEFVVGFGLALLLQGRIKGSRLIRTLVLLPMIMAPVVVGLTWLYLYHSEFGLFTWTLRLLRIIGHHIAPIGNIKYALPSIMLVDIWQWTPFMFLVLLSGLEALPVAPYEAARIDKASWWLVFRRITLPLMRPVILVVLLLRLMDALRVFDIIYILTEGGPGSVTEVLSMHIYREAFLIWDIGYAAALSIVMLYIILVSCAALANLLEREGT